MYTKNPWHKQLKVLLQQKKRHATLRSLRIRISLVSISQEFPPRLDELVPASIFSLRANKNLAPHLVFDCAFPRISIVCRNFYRAKSTEIHCFLFVAYSSASILFIDDVHTNCLS